MRRSPKIIALAIACIGLPAMGYAEGVAHLPTVYVEAKSVAPSVFKGIKVKAEAIQKKGAVDLKTALRDIPGVEVLDTQGTRQGNDSVNIRGLSGNRVAMSIDGIDLPEANEMKHTGQYAIFGRGNFMDVSALSSVDISKNTRGFGLGGVVAMQTLSADEILQGENQGGYVDTQYNSVDRSTAITGAAALKDGYWRGMVLGTYRKGNESDNRGDVGGKGALRTKADPVDHNGRYFLTKHEFDINDKNTINFTAEYLSRNQWTDSLSQVNRSYTDIGGADDNKKTRFSLGHDFYSGEGLIYEGKTQLYWQQTKTDSVTHRQYVRGCSSMIPGVKNRCAFEFGNRDKVWGLTTDWRAHFDGGGLNQDWRYGLSFARHELSSDWQGYYARSKPNADNKTIRTSIYVDGDLQWGNLMVSPSVSAHYYNMKPDDGSFFTGTDNSIGDLRKKHQGAITPRLGISYQISPLLVPYFQYARGFNTPSSQQLASSWNPGNYSSWGNPNLKAETANNFELGIRGKNSVFEYGIAGFDNHYKNFIDYVNVADQVSLPAVWSRYQTLVLQAQNFSKAHIYGGEAYTRWNFAQDWKASGSIAYSRGSIRQNGVDQPLNSVMPVKVKLGLAYEGDVWGANLDFTYVAKKDDGDLQNTGYYNPSRNYALVDFGGYWKPTKHLSFRAGVNNVFNQKYWNWADIAYMMPNVNSQAGTSGQSDGNATKLNKYNADFYSAPGRTFNVGLRYTF
ncbi:TonB-dependent receptor domain-containing protein [Snodgrassella communis]|uniref:TonB-dependent receptor domain-containing protein n=1 Tax=Snodgrassella communis TaxID=2946699 RepID=UPI00286AB06B|nr:TonB-dependent receptor [Snodgrassella communis]WMY92087.1 TonB-dependent receptor [Snodgrassella communis]